MDTIKTEVNQRGEAISRFAGDFQGYRLNKTDKTISQTLANKLYRYAKNVLINAGFKDVALNWNVSVSTNDARLTLPERLYHVEFVHPTLKTELNLCGIMVNDNLTPWAYYEINIRTR